jgi:two-component system, chemotaxis family, response regulator Rcp1
MNKTVAKPVFEQGRQGVVLLVEDNADHAFIAQEAFDEFPQKVNLQHVDDGEKCLAFLRREAPYETAPRPDLILLDLHMPRMNGFEVMEAIARDKAFSSIAVVVLTTSSTHFEVQRMYQLGCHSYLIKPVNFRVFSAAIEQLASYWFGLVVLPELSA